MPTRVYFPSTGAAPVTPVSWQFTTQIAVPGTLRGVVNEIGSAMTTYSGATGTTSPVLRGMGRWVVGPLLASQISGTVKGGVRMTEDNAGANATVALAIKLIQPDGSDRAILLAPTASDLTTTTPPELLVSTTPQSGAATRPFQTAAEAYALDLTPQTPVDGDYLVIEVGFRAATTVTRTIYVRVGDSATEDLPENQWGTVDGNPWLEFSNTLPLKIVQEGTNSGGHDVTDFVWAPTGKQRLVPQMRIGFRLVSPQNHATTIGDYSTAAGKSILFPNCLEWLTDEEKSELFGKVVDGLLDIYHRRHN